MKYEIVAGDIKDFSADWSAELAANGADTILTSTWTNSGGVTVNSDSVLGGECIVWVTGGAVSATAVELVNTIVTDGGRRLSTSLFIYVVPRRTE